MKKQSVLFLLFLLLPACMAASVPPEVKEALKIAGANRSSLERVLQRYRNEPEKYRAACFLIAHMPLHRQQARVCRIDTLAEEFRRQADSIYSHFITGLSDEVRNRPDTVRALRKLEAAFREKVQATEFGEPEVEVKRLPDITTLDSAFLVSQIEHAFALRAQSPLVARLEFDDFCEMVLPYRSMGNYPLVYPASLYAGWFDRYLRAGETDSVQLVADRYKHVENHLRSFLGAYPFLNNMGAAELFWNGVHDCTDIAYYGACVMRACGVPALVGYNSANKYYAGRHFHVAVIDKDGRWCTFSPESNLPQYRDQRFTQSANILYLYFGRRYNNPAALCAKGEPIPENLADPCIEDHTERIMKTFCIDLSCGTMQTKNKLAYLATFDVETGLQAVTWGVIDHRNKKVTFEKVVPDNLYFPVYCTEEGTLKPFGEPFLLKNDRRKPSGFRIEPVSSASSSGEVQVCIRRKFPVKPAMRKLAEQTVGTVVIASDRGDFKKADTLARIAVTPLNDWQDLELNNRKAYRHYRIVSAPADRHIRLAEVEFLTAADYGYPNVMPATPFPGDTGRESLVRLLAEPLEKCRHRKEYDGNMQTAPEAYPSITFRPNTPQVVTRLRYAVKHAGNTIVWGNKYQLFVWEKDGWKLLWTRRAHPDTWCETALHTGRLYWLHCPAQGTEEMPFTIDKEGRQRFVLERFLP